MMRKQDKKERNFRLPSPNGHWRLHSPLSFLDPRQSRRE
eukprot:04633.XXX_86076_86192_1 [CDS] Oithona nana genome sequencing.